jgi:hypothetical protein
MYINAYALEVMTKTKLADLRADAARHVLLASLGKPRRSVWVAVSSMLHRDVRRANGRKIVSARPA